MRPRVVAIVAVFAVLALLGIVGFVWVAGGSFRVCLPSKLEDTHQKTIATLDGIVDLGLKLTTTLVGVGSALLVGLKSGLKMTLPVQLIIVVATLLFIQSALYAVWWRLGVAEIWLNECFDMLTEARLQRRFVAHIYFFFLGLCALGGLVITALFAERTPDTGGDT